MATSLDETIERTQWDLFWPPAQVGIVDRPEILYLHYGRDRIQYNLVTRTRAAPGRLPALAEEVVEAHRGVRSRWMVPCTIPREPLERTLEAAGYRPGHRHHACAIGVGDHADRPAPGIEVRAVNSLARLRDLIEVHGRAFGPGAPPDEAELRRDLEECTRPGSRVFRCVAYDAESGAPLCSGGLTFYPDLRFGFLWGGGTVPEARGRGAYSAVLAARIRAARGRGLTHVGLYARVESSAPIVLRQGFERFGPMTFWERAAD